MQYLSPTLSCPHCVFLGHVHHNGRRRERCLHCLSVFTALEPAGSAAEEALPFKARAIGRIPRHCLDILPPAPRSIKGSARQRKSKNLLLFFSTERDRKRKRMTRAVYDGSSGSKYSSSGKLERTVQKEQVATAFPSLQLTCGASPRLEE